MQEKYFFAGVTSCVCPFCNQWPNTKKRTDKKANLVHSFTGRFEDSPRMRYAVRPSLWQAIKRVKKK